MRGHFQEQSDTCAHAVTSRGALRGRGAEGWRVGKPMRTLWKTIRQMKINGGYHAAYLISTHLTLVPKQSAGSTNLNIHIPTRNLQKV